MEVITQIHGLDRFSSPSKTSIYNLVCLQEIGQYPDREHVVATRPPAPFCTGYEQHASPRRKRRYASHKAHPFTMSEALLLIFIAKCRSVARVKYCAAALDLIDDQHAGILGIARRVGRGRDLQALLDQAICTFLSYCLSKRSCIGAADGCYSAGILIGVVRRADAVG